VQRQAVDLVDEWWADVFGIAREQVWRAVTVRPHTRLSGYEGFFVAWREAGVHVSLPAAAEPVATASLTTAGLRALQTSEYWASLATSVQGRLIGPSTHHYLDTDPGPDERVVPMARDDLWVLRAAVSPREWGESGFDDDEVEAGFGIVEDGQVVAAATLSSWHGAPRDVGVLVAPAHRGHRLVDAVGRTAASYAIREHGLARWVARTDNRGSVGAARRLGFEAWCAQLAIRQ
jgi:hypothetical protein